MNIDEALQSAAEHFQAGNLRQAESLYREILKVWPQNFDALYMLGVIFYESGNYDCAIAFTERALQVDPGNAAAHYNLGLSSKGRGQAGKAISCYRRAIELNPNFALAYCNLGAAFQEMSEFDKAILYYQGALGLDPSLVSAYYNLGSIFQEKGQLDEAVKYYQKTLELDPKFADVWNSMGIIFQEKGQFDEAIRYYQGALDLDPKLVDAYYNLGKVLMEKGQIDEAIAHYQKALQLNPNSEESYNNLGFCLQERGQYDEALICFQKAININPNFAEAYYNLALYHHERNLVDEAIEYYKKAIEYKPDFTDAHWNMACALLLSGNFEQGWKEYEWRWKLKEHRGHIFSHPLWDGSDISGRTILLHAEQGFGDTIQFVRYAPLVAKCGGKVILQCPGELLSLLNNIEGISRAVADGGRIPEFDLHCPILSLPLIFGTNLENIPCEIPYLGADCQLIQKWRDRLQHDAAGLRVGLAWRGREKAKRERIRSCPPELFSVVSGIKGIIFYSLQKEGGSEKMLPRNMELVDYMEEICDFSDTAAFISNLDLVISIDTAVAHLAGAIGKPVWTLLPFVPDWRWLLDRDDSPWYPTMRLFRQQSPGDWESVISRVERELREYISKERS